MTASRIVHGPDGRRFVEIVEPGAGGVKRYLVRGNDIRGDVDFTGEPTGKLPVASKPAAVSIPADAGTPAG